MSANSEYKKAGRRSMRPVHDGRSFAVVAAAGIVFMLSCMPVYGETSVSTTQHIETGVIEIDLREKAGGNTDGSEKEMPYLLPGETIENVYEIVNKGCPCYVRASCSFTEFNDELEIYGIPDEWVYNPADGYYYYTEVLENGSVISFFEGFNVPVDFPQDNENMAIELNVFAQAVQAENFTPDLASDAPWGSIVIEDASITKEYSVSGRILGNGALRVTYLGGAEQLFVNRNDLFSNLPFVMPGDVFEQTVSLKNTGGKAVDLYFYTACPEEDELLEKIALTLRADTGNGSRLIYQGPLTGRSLEGRAAAALLGTVMPGGTGTLTFSLDVPKELTNAYSLNASEVRWIFAAETIERNITTVYSGKNPNTGDNNGTGIYIIVLAATAAAAAGAIIKKRRRSY